MLSNLLGWIVGLGSIGLFLSGFFLPEVKRNNDPIWSGVGLIYALALWVNGDRTPGGLLFGEMASVTLLVWFGWQMVQQRRQLVPTDAQTPIPNSLESLTPFLKAGLERMQTAYGELSTQVQGYLDQDGSEADQPTPPQSLQKDWTDEAEWEEEPATPPISGEPDPDPSPSATPSEPPESQSLEEQSATSPSGEETVSATPLEEATPESDVSAATLAEPSAEVSVQTEPESMDAPAQSSPPPEEPETVNTADASEHGSAQSSEAEAESVPEPSAEQMSTPSDAVTEPVPEAAMAPSMESTEDTSTEDVSAAHTAEAEDDGSWPPPDPVT